MSAYSTETISREKALSMITQKLLDDLRKLDSLTNNELEDKIMEIGANDFLRNYEVV